MDLKPRRVLVTYESVTGNTKRVAEAIAAVIPGAVMTPIADAPDPGGTTGCLWVFGAIRGTRVSLRTRI